MFYFFSLHKIMPNFVYLDKIDDLKLGHIYKSMFCIFRSIITARFLEYELFNSSHITCNCICQKIKTCEL